MIIILLVILILYLATIFLIKDNPKSLITIMVRSSLSLVILFMIYLVLGFMDQGRTLVVSVLENWETALVTILLVNFMGLILSHFPHYFEIAFNRDIQVKWKKTHPKLPIGLIYYKPKTGEKKETRESKTQDQEFKEKIRERRNIFITFLRRHISLLTHIIWIGILLDVYFETFDYGTSSSKSLIIIWSVLALIQLGFELMLRRDVNDSSTFKKRVKLTLGVFQIFFIVYIVLFVYMLINISCYGWCKMNVVLMIVLSVLSAVLFIIFRLARKWFIYFKPDIQDDQRIGINYYRDRKFLPEMEKGEAFSVKGLTPFYYLANQVIYLRSMSFVGIFITIVILAYNLLPQLCIRHINPIPLVIMYLLIYYAIITIALKHTMFYTQLVDRIAKARIKHAKITPNPYGIKASRNIYQALPAFIAIFFLLGMLRPNQMNVVPVSDDHEVVTKKSFYQSLKTDNKTDKFVIGSYGGGLKANAWNLILLTEIIKAEPKFLDSTLCMSGVSGGAIGLANLTAMFNSLDSVNHPEWDSRIANIGMSNMLSTDVNGIFFKDQILKMFPFNFYRGAKDRAYDAMKLYSEFTGDAGQGLITSMKTYYHNVFNRQGYFPAIIFNTTPTQSKFGVACSVETMDDFPISINILEPNEKGESLTFYGAASTTNRFPIASPAARIKGKGHFVDGGYFENSGLLNAYSFYRQVRNDLEPHTEDFYAINIVNDKHSFIRNKFDELMKSHTIIEEDSGELTSIIKGIIALERMPEYAREVIENDPEIDTINIYMPEIYSVEDVAEVYGMSKMGSALEAQVRAKANTNRLTIIKALERLDNGYKYYEKGIVVPPTGRLLSKTAFYYQLAMAKYHQEVRANINRIDKILD